MIPTTSRAGCSCPNFAFHGGQLTVLRLSGLQSSAGDVSITPGKTAREFYAQSEGSDEGYTVVLSEDGPLNMICKHILAALWHCKIPVFIVEYNDPDWPGESIIELRTEAFWGSEAAVTAILRDGEVIGVTEIKPVIQTEKEKE